THVVLTTTSPPASSPTSSAATGARATRRTEAVGQGEAEGLVPVLGLVLVPADPSARVLPGLPSPSPEETKRPRLHPDPCDKAKKTVGLGGQDSIESASPLNEDAHPRSRSRCASSPELDRRARP